MIWLKSIGYAVVIAFALYGAYELLPNSSDAENVFHLTDFGTVPYGRIGFQSFDAKNFKDLVNGGIDAEHRIAGAELVLPESASPENKVPAIVILHGSGGDWSGRGINTALYLSRRGIAGIAVDTFGSRNLRKTDDYLSRIKKAPIFTQVADALSALKALQDHPYIDTEKIGVMGFSFGAGATLYTQFEPIIENVLGKTGPRFSAYAMFYGGCMVDFEDFRVEGSPLMIALGRKDKTISIPACQTFQQKLQGLNVMVDLHVYEDAGHGWNNPSKMQQIEEGKFSTRDCMMYTDSSGASVEVNSGNSMDNPFTAVVGLSGCMTRGDNVNGFNPEVTMQSLSDLEQFLSAAWGL